MIKLDGTECYFVPPSSKYGLAEIIPKYVTENSFTFIARCKIDWDSMEEGELSQEGGILMKNGQHMGIAAFKNDGNRYIKCSLWVQDRKGETKCIEKHFILTDEAKDKEYFISFRHDFKNKKLRVGNYDYFEEMTYKGHTVIDYSDSWLFIGAANAFESCNEEHRHYFRGEISFVSVHSEYLSDDAIKEIAHAYGNRTKLKKLQNLNTVLFSDFSIRTDYKVYDNSDNGNHIILYDKNWLNS